MPVGIFREHSRNGNLVTVFEGGHIEEQAAGIPLRGIYYGAVVGGSEISAVEVERSRGGVGGGEDEFAAVEG